MEWKTSVTEILGIKYPIIQGGLAYLAYADLCAAVSNAGGLGQITAMSLGSPDALRAEIKKVKTLTKKGLPKDSRKISINYNHYPNHMLFPGTI